MLFFFLMIRRPPRSTLDRSSAASDVYKRQMEFDGGAQKSLKFQLRTFANRRAVFYVGKRAYNLSLIHISEPTGPY